MIQNLDAGKNILAYIEFSAENFLDSLQILKNQS